MSARTRLAVAQPPADPLDMAEVLRARLKQAKVECSELHEATAERIALRVHDVRGSFVTRLGGGGVRTAKRLGPERRRRVSQAAKPD